MSNFYLLCHSKYNPVEGCWAALEQCCNGAILNSIETVFQWVSNMIWKSFNPIVHNMSQVYGKGIAVDKDTLAPYQVD